MYIKRGRLLHACNDCPHYYVIEDTCLTTCCGRSDCVSKKSCVIFDGRLRWDTRISGMDRGLIHRLRGCTDKINRIEASHLITITPRNLVTDTLSPLPPLLRCFNSTYDVHKARTHDYVRKWKYFTRHWPFTRKSTGHKTTGKCFTPFMNSYRKFCFYLKNNDLTRSPFRKRHDSSMPIWNIRLQFE